MAIPKRESDLYAPVKAFLESQGYQVKGEVGRCDVVAVRGQEAPVVVELKLQLNLELLLQAVDRVCITSKVYLAVPSRVRVLSRRRKEVIKLMRMLGLGLLLVDTDLVTVMLDPGEYRPRKSNFRKERLLGEFQARVGDPATGGVDRRRGIMTAYRQRALRIATFLRGSGPSKASEVASAVEEPKARAILYDNVYGWFERVSRGIYQVSPRGSRELPKWLGESS